ncbi:glycosyltransferase family 2 protein [Ectothiorhodospira lacustris]|uniref:glycosyltransferase family 2 protein n=1 Tax=Ectothiorhodospira lacustris TaxID=2899127 RepID=UPI001EE8F104|nr:glycosyltransferase family A protein [Ectothiorhodospira lacustris]MCG5510343.1 glycosyltransferase family 2 protein [Ectothiorhodospira lacustris]MCG5522089.1 glycosyltransferase family 2 protein [Ectothiorhodospira lacustris]
MGTPLVSVVMSVYNAGPYLGEAVESILRQTFRDFEFIIINDGSTDGSLELLDYYAGLDKRIRLVHQHNQGIPAALNRGIDLAKGGYIARMDADDISLPERLEKQYAFLESHPQVAVLGSQIDSIDHAGLQIDRKWALPSSAGLVAWRMLFRTSVAHPTVMMRSDVVRKFNGYSLACRVSQDHELWTRMISSCRIQNHQDVLLKRRVWGGNATFTKAISADGPLLPSLQELHGRYVDQLADLRDLQFCRNFVYYGMSKSMEYAKYSVADLQRVFSYIQELRKGFVRKHPYAYEDEAKILKDEHKKLMDIAYGVDSFSRVKGLALKLKTPFFVSQVKSRLHDRYFFRHG